jgi:N-methylhydantoinase A/oxoprolinase/acetone carboxylase beta subunit
MYRVGVDIGGTFTDFALFDARGAKMSVHKLLTTPHDPSEAVTAGIDVLLRRDGIAVEDVSDVVHGTTLVTNAVIERKGAITGMLATAGFSDILDMGFERRYDLFDLRVRYPPPLVPRRLRIEVAERVRFDGSVEIPLDECAVQRAAKRFQQLGVAAVAVCFLHSYANPAHEERAAQIMRKAAPELFVSASADVFPNMREFERWTTTTVNAFTQPMFDRYLERLERRLGGVDAFLAPTTPIPAPSVAEAGASRETYAAFNLKLHRNSGVGNYFNLCAVSLPCGFTSGGSPIGLMVHARPFHEGIALRVAHAYEQATEWHARRPDLSWAIAATAT